MNAVFGDLGLEIADLTHRLPDRPALPGVLVVGVSDGVLGVERALAPAGLDVDRMVDVGLDSGGRRTGRASRIRLPA
ncbi:hypothetical protein [Nocardia neocaledoniensis]|uniref:hypothetical protein n=1 Tax=Nocardia neocaledoniensis TaxID=236511 RepID=UPI00245571E0|nr:hypothetical protein [Nocardia neocaledoniensis]